MKDIMTTDYQDCVSKVLIRNKSILDILSKLNTTQANIQRSVSKSVTHCGCIEIEAKKQKTSDSLDEYSEMAKSHVKSHLCSECKSNLEKEMGAHLFYFAALCDTLDMDMYDIILKEKKNLETLGKFTMR